MNDGRCHVRYTNRHEWADGDSGFTGSRGGSRHHQLIEADVDLQRISAVPTNSHSAVTYREGGWKVIESSSYVCRMKCFLTL